MNKREIKDIKERIKNEFFIDTNGKIIRWKGDIEEANDWASLHALISNYQVLAHIPDIKAGMRSGTDVLNNLGWIAMGSAAYGKLISRKPTQAQINTLDKLGFKKIRDSNGVMHEW